MSLVKVWAVSLSPSTMVSALFPNGHRPARACGPEAQRRSESGLCFELAPTGEILSVIPQGTDLSFTAAQQAVDHP